MSNKRILGYYNNTGNTAVQTGVATLRDVSEQINSNAWPYYFTGFAVATSATSPWFVQLRRNFNNSAYALVEGGVDILPTGGGNDIAYSPDGAYLAVAHSITPFVTIYKRNGIKLTKLTNPTTLPVSTGNGVSWSPDGIYLAVAHTSSPYITIYKRNCVRTS